MAEHRRELLLPNHRNRRTKEEGDAQGRENGERAIFFGILSEIILGHFAHFSNSTLAGKEKKNGDKAQTLK